MINYSISYCSISRIGAVESNMEVLSAMGYCMACMYNCMFNFICCINIDEDNIIEIPDLYSNNLHINI